MDDPFAQGYDRATRMMLNGVFARAWDQLQVRHKLAAEAAHAPEARDELATRIADAYEKGERDPETIEYVALRAFDRWIKPD